MVINYLGMNLTVVQIICEYFEGILGDLQSNAHIKFPPWGAKKDYLFAVWHPEFLE